MLTAGGKYSGVMKENIKYYQWSICAISTIVIFDKIKASIKMLPNAVSDSDGNRRVEGKFRASNYMACTATTHNSERQDSGSIWLV